MRKGCLGGQSGAGSLGACPSLPRPFSTTSSAPNSTATSSSSSLSTSAPRSAWGSSSALPRPPSSLITRDGYHEMDTGLRRSPKYRYLNLTAARGQDPCREHRGCEAVWVGKRALCFPLPLLLRLIICCSLGTLGTHTSPVLHRRTSIPHSSLGRHDICTRVCRQSIWATTGVPPPVRSSMLRRPG